ncbi:armadillo-type protein [Mycena epipterygia]|nr:armadillo-type protein [Mycena epipterygia]
MSELSMRVAFTNEARVVLDFITEFLSSTNPEVQRWACEILGRMAHRDSLAGAVLSVKPCRELISLLHDEHVDVLAIRTLALIIKSPEGAQAAVDANALDDVTTLLESRNAEVRSWTCEMLGELALHEATARAVLAIKPCDRLVSLLHANDLDVFRSAAAALCNIAQWPDGAQAAVQAKALNCVPELLESSNVEVRMWTCKLLGFLTRHLVSLLWVGSLEVIETATPVLYWIAKHPAAAQAVVDANGLNYVAKLLESSTAEVREWTCEFLGVLARHESTATAVWNIHPCLQLISLLRWGSINAPLTAVDCAPVMKI